MIIMLNGAFGVGKTTTAAELSSLIPNSIIYDPEEVGFMLRDITQPEDPLDDFQDNPLWPPLVVEVAGRLRRHYGRHLLVPMTITHLPYFPHIKCALTRLDPAVHHFALLASVTTIRDRLLRRGDEANNWAARQADRCVAALSATEFAVHTDTEQRDAAGSTVHHAASANIMAINPALALHSCANQGEIGFLCLATVAASLWLKNPISKFCNRNFYRS